jgi:hypothetical protein
MLEEYSRVRAALSLVHRGVSSTMLRVGAGVDRVF